MLGKMFAVRTSDGQYYVTHGRQWSMHEADATAFISRPQARAMARWWSRNRPAIRVDVVEIWRLL